MKKLLLFLSVICSIIIAISVILHDVFLKTDKKKFSSKFPYEERKWLKKVSFKEHYINSVDKIRLHAISVTNNTKDWAILVHGYDSEARNMACYAEKFYAIGYNVLLVDQRGFGLSEGNHTTMGFKEQYDILGWIDFLISNKADKIVLFGVSMGASTVMLVSAHKLPNNVKCVIEDCGYTSVYDEFKYNLRRMFGLPSFPFLNIVDKITKLNGWSLIKDVSCLEAVKNSQLPILFIHGSSDNFVPFYMHDELYEAAVCPKDKLVIYGAGHAEAHLMDSKQYWIKIDEFINRYK